MKYLVVLISLILVACDSSKKEEDHDYLIQAFGKSYVCEDIQFRYSGAYLIKCVNTLDSSDKIEGIENSTNFIQVGDLI